MGTYEVTTDRGTYQIETEDPSPSIGGLASNFLSDIAQPIKHPIDTLSGFGEQIKTGALDYPKEATDTLAQVVGNTVAGQPVGETPMAKRAADISNAPLVQNPGKELYEHPGNAAMMAAPFVGSFMPKTTPGVKPLSKTPPEMASPEVPLSENVPPLKSQPVGEVPPKSPLTAQKPVDPLQAMKDFTLKKYGQAAEKPGFVEKSGKYLKNEVADFRGKDIGLRDPMIRSLDPKNPLKALEKAEGLMDYAAEEGYFKPALTDISRKEAIKSRISQTGKNIGAVREVGGQRAVPPIAEIRQTLINELTKEYGNKALHEIKTVLDDFDRKVGQDPSFEGLSKVSTYLNGEQKTFNKIGQNSGPTTDGANIISRESNKYLRKVLSPEENGFYTKNLRDFGAHKKLEQMVASAGRRHMTGRGAPGGALSALWQQMWDRGGYRMAGNVADRMGNAMVKNPAKFKTLPDFFEEFAHHASDVLDESLDIGGLHQGMAHGGIVGMPELNNFLTNKYAHKGDLK